MLGDVTKVVLRKRVLLGGGAGPTVVDSLALGLMKIVNLVADPVKKRVQTEG